MATLEAKRKYEGIDVGDEVRRQLAHTYIYRVRVGNGSFNSKVGVRYQDRYAYVVPSSINNPEGAAARSALTQAVDNWQNIVTPTEKAEWRRLALERGRVSGYALYVGQYIKANT